MRSHLSAEVKKARLGRLGGSTIFKTVCRTWEIKSQPTNDTILSEKNSFLCKLICPALALRCTSAEWGAQAASCAFTLLCRGTPVSTCSGTPHHPGPEGGRSPVLDAQHRHGVGRGRGWHMPASESHLEQGADSESRAPTTRRKRN